MYVDVSLLSVMLLVLSLVVGMRTLCCRKVVVVGIVVVIVVVIVVAIVVAIVVEGVAWTVKWVWLVSSLLRVIRCG